MDLRRNRDNAGLSALQEELVAMCEAIVKEKGLGKMSEEEKETYKKLGGTPFLDGQYTVFGEVEEGLEVVAKIQEVTTDSSDRPLKDLKMEVSVIEE